MNCSDPWLSPPDTSSALIQCLKQLPCQDLIDADLRRPKYLSAFGPTIDRRSGVLPTDVRGMMSRLSESAFPSTAVLAAVTRREGLSYVSQRDISRGLTTDRTRRMLRTYAQNVFDFHRQSILDILSHQYTDWERPQRNDPMSNLESTVDLIGDGQVTAPLVDLVLYHARHATSATYLGVFDVNFAQDGAAYPRWATGAPGEDLAYVFGAPLVDRLAPFAETFRLADRGLAETVMRYWTNFIKNGSVRTQSKYNRISL